MLDLPVTPIYPVPADEAQNPSGDEALSLRAMVKRQTARLVAESEFLLDAANEFYGDVLVHL